MATEKFVKDGNLVVIVEANEGNTETMLSFLRLIGYTGHIQKFKTSTAAIHFLNAVVDQQGRPVPATLVFCSYSPYGGSIKLLLEEF